MATRKENLQTTLDNIASELATLTDPNARKLTYSVAGRSVSWGEYRDWLSNEYDKVEARLNRADGPFMIRTRGVFGR